MFDTFPELWLVTYVPGTITRHGYRLTGHAVAIWKTQSLDLLEEIHQSTGAGGPPREEKSEENMVDSGIVGKTGVGTEKMAYETVATGWWDGTGGDWYD